LPLPRYLLLFFESEFLLLSRESRILLFFFSPLLRLLERLVASPLFYLRIKGPLAVLLILLCPILLLTRKRLSHLLTLTLQPLPLCALL
jgi:hypothetical protein